MDVSVDVANVGLRAGEEVVQLYAGFPESAVERPKKLLRGFEKVSSPRERRARFTSGWPAADLAYYDVASHAWRVEPTEYTVEVGGSSRPQDLVAAGFRVGEVGQRPPLSP